MHPGEVTELSRYFSYQSVKRAIDVVLALSLTLLTAPFLLLAVIFVRLTSDGPVIYVQTRMGKGRRLFTIFKIRTMYHDCERYSGPRWSTENDPRVTAVGHILRRTHLDELPQLWNVVRGEMSLVGPRPERPEFIGQLEKVVPRYAERLSVLPGVSGLAQVNLPPDTDHESVRCKLVYDLHYVEHQSAWLDLRIMVGTAFYLMGMPRLALARLLGLRPACLARHDVRSRAVEVNAGREMVSQALPAWRDT